MQNAKKKKKKHRGGECSVAQLDITHKAQPDITQKSNRTYFAEICFPNNTQNFMFSFLLQTDMLSLECTYNSSDRQAVTKVSFSLSLSLSLSLSKLQINTFSKQQFDSKLMRSIIPRTGS